MVLTKNATRTSRLPIYGDATGNTSYDENEIEALTRTFICRFSYFVVRVVA